MPSNELWTAFQKTGRVEDYLSYKGVHLHDETLGELEIGDKTVESKNNGDRDGIIRHTYR